MGIFLALALVLTIDHDSLIYDNVDVVEINHCYGGDGEKRFTQTIFWEWRNLYPEGDYIVVDWRIVKDQPQPHPRKDYSKGGYTLIWNDQGTWRRVRSVSMRETWTQYDPELDNRQIFPTAKRRGLTKGK